MLSLLLGSLGSRIIAGFSGFFIRKCIRSGISGPATGFLIAFRIQHGLGPSGSSSQSASPNNPV